MQFLESFAFLLLNANVCHAYKSVLIAIKKFYQISPEFFSYTLAVTDKALCSS